MLGPVETRLRRVAKIFAGGSLGADQAPPHYCGGKWQGAPPVLSYPANAWGCTTWPDKPVENPRGPQNLVVGQTDPLPQIWNDANLRAASRDGLDPAVSYDSVGFRCARDMAP